MIKKEDLIRGSVIELENKKFPAIIIGANNREDKFDIIGIIYIDGIPELTENELRESDLEKCRPVRFDIPTPFIKFVNYSLIVEMLKEKGYSTKKNENNSRTISWIEGGKEQVKLFKEVHLFQKFIYEKINDYLVVEL